jgi:hypothetical protein
VQPVQGDQGGDEDRDRQDQGQQLGQAQQRDLQEDRGRLALLDDDVEHAEALAEQGDAGERDGGGDGGAEQLAEEVTLDELHETGRRCGPRGASAGSTGADRERQRLS